MLDDLPFQPPAAWRRRTMLSFVEPPGEGTANPATIVVAREALDEGVTIHTLADQLLAEVRDLPGFRPLGHRAFEWSGEPAVELRFEWVSPTGPLEQSSTFVETSNEEGRSVTNVTTTCATKDAPAKALIFAQLLQERPAPRISTVVPKAKEEEVLPLPDIPPMPFIPMPGRRERR